MRAGLVIAVVLGLAGATARVARADDAPARAENPPNVVVVIDRSLPAAKLAAITGALADAARAWPADAELGVVLAGPQPAIDVPLGPAAKARIRGVRTAARGDLRPAIRLAGAQLAALPPGHPLRRILVITDGNDLLPIGAVAVEQARRGIHVSALGYQSMNRVTLGDIATGGAGRLFLADDPTALAATFAELGRLAPAVGAPTPSDLALVLVVDRSASLQGPALEIAKETARATVEVLSPDDYVAVVGFDTDATTLVTPQRAANKMRISNQIAKLQPGGGTNIYAGLAEASKILGGINATRKYVVLISDGEGTMDGVEQIVSDMHAARIDFAIVGVQRADRINLSAIASAGDGRLYIVEDIGALPKIFTREAAQAPVW